MSPAITRRAAAGTAVLAAAILALPMLTANPATAAEPDPVQLFASPTVADGAGDCTDASPCSLTDAVTAERAARAAMGETMTSDIVVYLRDGTYRLAAPLEIGAADSGSSPDKRVIFRNYPGESPVLSGGTAVTGWTELAGEPGVWTASTAGIADFLQLYATGHDLVRAQTEPVEGQRYTVPGTAEHQIRVPATAVPDVADLSGVQVRTMHTWRSLRYNVASIGDPVTENGEQYRYIRLDGRLATHSSETRDLRGENVFVPAEDENGDPILPDRAAKMWPVDTAGGDRYYPSGDTVFSGAREFMDTDGEWFLDPDAGQVYLKADFDPNTVEVSAPVLEKILAVDGASHVSIYGLQFAHSAWNTPLEHGNFQRQGGVRMWDAADPDATESGFITNPETGEDNPIWWVNPAAVTVGSSSDIRFNRNGFRDTGANAVNLDKGTKDILFRANVFTDIADTGLFVGTAQQPWLPVSEQNIDTTVVDNVFRDMGATYATDSAITMTYPRRAEIHHNLIERVNNIAINIGYVLGMTGVEKDLTAVKITKNRIDHACLTARDCGAWHAVGLSRFGDGTARSRVARNYITNVHENTNSNGTGSHVYALYADGASAGWVLEQNVWHDIEEYDTNQQGNGCYVNPGCDYPGLRVNNKTVQHKITIIQDGQQVEVDPLVWHKVTVPYNTSPLNTSDPDDDPCDEDEGDEGDPEKPCLINIVKAEAGLSQGYRFVKGIDLAVDSVGGLRGPHPEVP